MYDSMAAKLSLQDMPTHRTMLACTGIMYYTPNYATLDIILSLQMWLHCTWFVGVRIVTVSCFISGIYLFS